MVGSGWKKEMLVTELAFVFRAIRLLFPLQLSER
jgi:hypothetical protein